jgi:HSP90 family molecular chaperone
MPMLQLNGRRGAKMMSKQQIHKMVDELPEQFEETVSKFLEFLLMGLDNEPFSQEEILAINQSEKDIAEGRTISLDDYIAGKRI